MGGGIKVGSVTGANHNTHSSGSKGKGSSSPKPEHQSDDCCKLPSNPFKGASNNPFDLYGRVSGFISGLFGTEKCVENQMTDSITNPKSKANPNFLILMKTKIMALLGMMYDFLNYLTLRVKADKEATKDAYQVGFA